MSNLSDFVIENGVLVKYIGNNSEIEIPESVTFIGERAFANCSQVRKIFIPEGVKTIEAQAFYCCIRLEELTIPASVRQIKEAAFRNCDGIKNVTFRNGIVDIGEHAFAYCDSLQNIIFPESVVKIGYLAFCCFNLKSITILNKATEIASDAFRRNKNLVILSAQGSTAEIYARENGIAFEAI